MAASGLHARPAAALTHAAAASGHTISLGRVDEPAVDASSILMVMSLGLKQGDEVVLTAEAAAAESTLDALAALVSSDLDAPGAGR